MVKIENLYNAENLEEVLQELEIKGYISLVEKIAMINQLVDILVKQDENGMYVVDSIEKEVKSKVASVALYTNIELTHDDYYNYDILNASGLLKGLIDTQYCKDDMQLFYDMLNAKIEDKLFENSVNHIIAVRTKEMVNVMQKTMSHVDAMLDKGDPNIIAKHLSKGIEAVAKKLPDFSKLESLNYLEGLKRNGTK